MTTETSTPTETPARRRRWRLPALIGGVALLAGLGIGIAAQSGVDGHWAGPCSVTVTAHSTDQAALPDAELGLMVERTVHGPTGSAMLSSVVGPGIPAVGYDRCPQQVTVTVQVRAESLIEAAVTLNPATGEVASMTGWPAVVTRTADGVKVDVGFNPDALTTIRAPAARTNTVVVNPGSASAAGPVTVTTHPTDSTPPMTTTVGVETGSARLDLGVMNAGTVSVHRDGVADLTLPVTDGQLQMPANPNTQTGWKLQQIGGDTCAAAQPAACETTLTITPTEVK